MAGGAGGGGGGGGASGGGGVCELAGLAGGQGAGVGVDDLCEDVCHLVDGSVADGVHSDLQAYRAEQARAVSGQVLCDPVCMDARSMLLTSVAMLSTVMIQQGEARATSRHPSDSAHGLNRGAPQ